MDLRNKEGHQAWVSGHFEDQLQNKRNENNFKEGKKKALFCRNVGEVVHSSHIRCIAVPVVEKCGGHLLTIILTAKALREVNMFTIGNMHLRH